jgi:hypothetical protein
VVAPKLGAHSPDLAHAVEDDSDERPPASAAIAAATVAARGNAYPYVEVRERLDGEPAGRKKSPAVANAA